MTQKRTAIPRDGLVTTTHAADTAADCAARAKGAESRLRLSLSQFTTLRWSMPEEVACAAASGYEAMGLWRMKLADFGHGRAEHVLHDFDLKVSSLSWAGAFTGSHGFSFDEAVDDARAAVRRAAALKAETLVMIGGTRSGHTTRHAKRLVRDGLLAVADEAAERGVRLGLLPMHAALARRWTFQQSTHDALEIIHSARHPAIGLVFDIYHLWQEPGLIARIPELAPLVTLVQIADSRGEPRHEYDRILPGDGLIPLDEIIPSFLRAGYRGYFEVHVWSEALWRRGDAAFVPRCVQFLQGLDARPCHSTIPA
ncbi:MAG: sugar phosphate isomerase/epimerase [Planctomycetaceae bacterium]|nr:sugar phosphate isomerase/epimerase [Planctomycetaceae bacterium]